MTSKPSLVWMPQLKESAPPTGRTKSTILLFLFLYMTVSGSHSLALATGSLSVSSRFSSDDCDRSAEEDDNGPFWPLMRHHAILHFRVQSDVVPWMFDVPWKVLSGFLAEWSPEKRTGCTSPRGMLTAAGFSLWSSKSTDGFGTPPT